MKLFKQQISREALRYMIVGSGGFVIDVGVFNAISITREMGFHAVGPVSAKVTSVILAIAFTYFGNSRWTFRSRSGRPEGLNRISRYAAVNAVGLAVSVLPLYISRYILGYDSLLADNISANVIGVGLAMGFRFFANRVFVFKKASNGSL